MKLYITSAKIFLLNKKCINLPKATMQKDINKIMRFCDESTTFDCTLNDSLKLLIRCFTRITKVAKASITIKCYITFKSNNPIKAID